MTACCLSGSSAAGGRSIFDQDGSSAAGGNLLPKMRRSGFSLVGKKGAFLCVRVNTVTLIPPIKIR
jgi:hypothetical protein